MRLFRPLLCASAGLAITACGDSFGPIDELPRQLTVAEQKLVEADNRFAFKLFKEINSQEEPDKNVFISPLSVAMALGMTYNGAAGTTREAMQQTLELQGMTIQEVNESYRSLIDLLQDLDPAVEWILANSIWYTTTFITPLQSFIDVNRTYFDAEVRGLDFSSPAASDAINSWVNDKTRGRIEKIVPEEIPP
ncbi:MAG: serpin family protein, partial [Gemmatimonadales bacterium]